MLIQPTGKDISSDSSESACCGGTYGSGGSGGFGISITVPSGKLFSSSEVYLETNNEKHKNICQLNNDCNSSLPLKKKSKDSIWYVHNKHLLQAHVHVYTVYNIISSLELSKKHRKKKCWLNRNMIFILLRLLIRVFRLSQFNHFRQKYFFNKRGFLPLYLSF